MGGTLRVEGRTENIWLGRICDLLKLFPSLLWGAMSVMAFPAYFGMGWYMPAFLSVVSTGLAVAFAYEVIMFHSRFKYVVAGDYLMGWHENKPKNHLIKIAVAGGCLVVFIVLASVQLSTFYTYIKPCNDRYNTDAHGRKCCTGFGVEPAVSTCCNKTLACPANLKPAPCNGKCEGCAVDPDCKRWGKFIMEQEGMTKICPLPKDDYKGDATFSCEADGYWMICTCVINALWLTAILFSSWRSGRVDETRRSETSGSINDTFVA